MPFWYHEKGRTPNYAGFKWGLEILLFCEEKRKTMKKKKIEEAIDYIGKSNGGFWVDCYATKSRADEVLGECEITYFHAYRFIVLRKILGLLQTLLQKIYKLPWYIVELWATICSKFSRTFSITRSLLTGETLIKKKKKLPVRQQQKATFLVDCKKKQ